MLDFGLTKRLGDFRLEAALTAEPGAPTVIVGESGSGKTTLLRLLAGLEAPDAGHIRLNEDTWYGGGRSRPARDRQVGYVAQDHALFPHLSAAANVGFGLEAHGVPGREAFARAHAALARVGVGDLAERFPHELSGGQQQRVAIARAIVGEPRVLLLDEPLSALDARSRREVRVQLARLFAELPCVTLHVTHHPAEAMAMGGRIVVLEDGRITQSGTREELMRHPRSGYVAAFLGLNLVPFSAPEAAPGSVRIATPHGPVALAGPAGSGMLVVHPRDITLSLERPAGSARNVFEGVIEEMVPEPPLGEMLRVAIAASPPLVALITPAAASALALRTGRRVFASFKAAGVAELE